METVKQHHIQCTVDLSEKNGGECKLCKLCKCWSSGKAFKLLLGMQSMVSAGGSGGDGKSADDAWFLDVPKRLAGWWFRTFFLTFHILGRIIPTDFHIFQRGRFKPPTS